MKIAPDNTLFVMIDIQERFRPAIDAIDTVARNAGILNRVAERLEMPLLVTEQYPEGLGRTCDEIFVPAAATRFEKKRFSIFEPPIHDWLVRQERDWLVLYGIETHVCVLQSALEAIQRGWRVQVVADAVGSRTTANRDRALDRLAHAGVVVSTTEMALFELLDNADHPAFRALSKLIK
ncbi:MAG: isochorismatase family protein [Candidatus Cloacimonetes bacterium]|nr:isochorismatase family protein [Candidatus Cloacimonadota bacterium]